LANKAEFPSPLSSIITLHSELKPNFYLEYHRRKFVVNYLKRYVTPPASVIELGASPFILAAMLVIEGYEVTAVDIEPEDYIDIAKLFNIKVIKHDLERTPWPISTKFDAATLAEVIEHLNPFYVPQILSELNRILKKGGVVILTTPNIVSLLNRIRLLLGKNPIGKYHTREYTLSEIVSFFKNAGFRIISAGYTDVIDKRPFPRRYDDKVLKTIANIHSFTGLFLFSLKNPSKINTFKILTYPLVKIFPQLRETIFIIARKVSKPKQIKVKRYSPTINSFVELE
jgi:SAM-dependent methyltransferase